MKTGFYSVIFAIISNGAMILCFIPFLFLGWKNMRKVSTCWVLGIYWFLTGLNNLLELWSASGFPGHHGSYREINIAYNLVETPLVLLAFALAKKGRSRRVLLLLLFLFVGTETILFRLKGNAAMLPIMASGLAIIILYTLMQLFDYLKKMEHTRFEHSMVFMYASLLFSYGSMLIIYVFAHYHFAGKTGNEMDSFLLYYISLLLSVSITCAGLLSYGIRRSRPGPWSASSGYSSSSS